MWEAAARASTQWPCGRATTPASSPSLEAKELIHWCRQVIGARVIAIDAPCRWSPDGHPRPCERQLMARGIRCFASPSRIKALDHHTDDYGWMLQGEALFQDLEPSHPLLTALPITGPGCFETFPHAITWHLRGGHATAANKRAQRSELLEQAGIDLASLTSIDRVDAALCYKVVLSSSPSRRRRKSVPYLW